MKNYIKSLLIIFILYLSCSGSWAENTGVNTFCDRTVSPVIKSMGDTGVCLDNDLTAAVYNPAAVSFINKGGTGFNYSSCLGLGNVYDLLYVHDGNASDFGVEMKFFNLEGFDLYDQNFKKVYSAAASDSLYSGFYSFKLNEKVSWGNKINYFRGTLINQDYSYVTADSGFFYKVSKKINWGSSIKNIPVVQKEWDTGTREKIFYSLESGVSYNIHIKNKRIITEKRRVPLEEILPGTLVTSNNSLTRPVTNLEPVGFIQGMEKTEKSRTGSDNKKSSPSVLKENTRTAESLGDSLLSEEIKSFDQKKVKKEPARPDTRREAEKSRDKKKDTLLNELDDELLGDEIEAAEDLQIESDMPLQSSRPQPQAVSNTQTAEPKEIPTRIITVTRTGYYYHDIIFSSALNYSGYYNSLYAFHCGARYEFQKTVGLGAGLIFRQPDTLFIFSTGISVQFSFFKAAYALYLHPVQSEHNAGFTINF